MKLIKKIEKYNNFVKENKFDGLLKLSFNNYRHNYSDDRVVKESIVEFFEFMKSILRLDEYFNNYVVSVYEELNYCYEEENLQSIGRELELIEHEPTIYARELFIEKMGYYLKEVPDIDIVARIYDGKSVSEQNMFEGLTIDTFFPNKIYEDDPYFEYQLHSESGNYDGYSERLPLKVGVSQRTYLFHLLAEGKNVPKEVLEGNRDIVNEKELLKFLGIKHLSIGMEFDVEIHVNRTYIDLKSNSKVNWLEKRIYKCKLLDYFKEIRHFDTHFTILFDKNLNINYAYLDQKKTKPIGLFKDLSLIDGFFARFDTYYEWYMNYRENPEKYRILLDLIKESCTSFDDMISKPVDINIENYIREMLDDNTFRIYWDSSRYPKYELIDENSRIKKLLIEGQKIENYSLEDDGFIYTVDRCNIYVKGFGKYKAIEKEFI